MKILTIPAKSHQAENKKRVAAYARVSKESDQLAHSLDAQIQHYSDLIQGNSDWVFAGVYSDEFITGTSTEHRAGFQKLMHDCEAGNIDMVLCKSVSRFSRNTVDLLSICRHLKNIGVDVQFEKEGIATLSADGELMLSLLASFAQEESRSISENIKWGIRKGFEVGRSTHYNLYGYAYNGKEYQIVPEQAAVVKRIYDTYLEGGTAEQLEKVFAAEKILGPKGGRFTATTIRRILQNSTYTGNTLLQREYIENHITHKRKKNNGELAMYFVEGTHPVIISQDTYDAVQAEMKNRSEGKSSVIRSKQQWYKGRLICGECGSTLRYMSKAVDNGTRRYGAFACRQKIYKGASSCTFQQIPEKAFKEALATVLEIPQFTEEAFVQNVINVTAENGHKMEVNFVDGRVVNAAWKEKRNHG